MKELNALERAVLDAMLVGETRGMVILRRQLPRCGVTERTLTGVGFWTDLEVDLSVESVPVIGDHRVMGVDAEIEGLEGGAAFVLLIRDGRLLQLEGYTHGDEWLESFVQELGDRCDE